VSTPKPARIHSYYGFTSSQVELGEAERRGRVAPRGKKQAPLKVVLVVARHYSLQRGNVMGEVILYCLSLRDCIVYGVQSYTL
jgi:hypothetical protein